MAMSPSARSGIGHRQTSSPVISPYSRSESDDLEHVRAIARSAIHSHTQLSGARSETPSVRSILAAYQQDGHGDRLLLLAILEAKKAEDQRLAARDNLRAEQLRAQHQGHQHAQSSSSSSSWAQPACSDQSTSQRSSPTESKGIVRREFSSSSPPSTSRPHIRSPKRARHSLCLLPSPDVTASRAKVTRSSFRRTFVGPVSSSHPKRLPHQTSLSRPRLSLDMEFVGKPGFASHLPTPVSLGGARCPSYDALPRRSPSALTHTRAESPISPDPQSHPSLRPISSLPALSGPISVTSSKLAPCSNCSSLARLLNEESVTPL